MVALNASGGSAPSNEMLLTVGAPCAPPAAAPILLAPTVSGNALALNWVPVAGSVTGYVVEAGSLAEQTDRLNTITAGTAYTWVNAPTGLSFVRVRALNTCGTGPASNYVTPTVQSGQGTNPGTPSCAGPISAFCGQATARCNNGQYSCSQNRSGTCSSNGGVACWVCPGTLVPVTTREREWFRVRHITARPSALDDLAKGIPTMDCCVAALNYCTGSLHLLKRRLGAGPQCEHDRRERAGQFKGAHRSVMLARRLSRHRKPRRELIPASPTITHES